MAKKVVDTTQFEAPEELSPGIDPIDRPLEMKLAEEAAVEAALEAKGLEGTILNDPDDVPMATLPPGADYRAPTTGRIVLFRYGGGLPDYAAIVTRADGESLSADLVVFTNDGRPAQNLFAVPWGLDKNTWHWPEIS